MYTALDEGGLRVDHGRTRINKILLGIGSNRINKYREINKYLGSSNFPKEVREIEKLCNIEINKIVGGFHTAPVTEIHEQKKCANTGARFYRIVNLSRQDLPIRLRVVGDSP
uniref:Transposase n=1 Tax=Strongyloides papillosus TaxID=174720 RepID=A0A0N5C522_STREA